MIIGSRTILSYPYLLDNDGKMLLLQVYGEAGRDRDGGLLSLPESEPFDPPQEHMRQRSCSCKFWRHVNLILLRTDRKHALFIV